MHNVSGCPPTILVAVFPCRLVCLSCKTSVYCRRKPIPSTHPDSEGRLSFPNPWFHLFFLLMSKMLYNIQYEFAQIQQGHWSSDAGLGAETILYAMIESVIW